MNMELLSGKLKSLQKLHPFYMEKLKGINMDEITTYKKFSDTIPVITKKDVFNPKHFRKFFPMQPGELIPSAGSSGKNFAYRYAGTGSHDTTDEKFQGLLRYWFHVLDLQRPTLVLNAYPLGIKLSSGPFTVLNAGTRDDIILQTLNYTSKQFTHVILIAQPHFIKYLLDEPAILKLIREYGSRIFVITGGYWFPLSFEKYVCHRLFGKNSLKYNTHFRSTYGAAEAGLGLMIEPFEKIRYSYENNHAETPVPLIYQWDPNRMMLELVKNELVYTALHEATPELLRYKLGDRGAFINGSSTAPLMVLYGRGKKCNQTGLVYSRLFEVPEMADKLSGCFLLDDEHTLHIQLKRGIKSVSAKETKMKTGYQTKIYTYDKYPYHRELTLKPRFE